MESGFIFGSVLGAELSEYFPHGMTLATEDGGQLSFRSLRTEFSEDDPLYVPVHFMSAIRPIDGREDSDDLRLFQLTTAFVDSGGQLWQRSRVVMVWEVWRNVVGQKELRQFIEQPVLREGERFLRRKLVETMETLCDMREDHLVEVIREGPGGGWENWLFRLKFKYFGAKMGLVEERRIQNGARGVIVQNELKVIIEPAVRTEALAVLNSSTDMPLPVPDMKLDELGPLITSLRMSSQWKEPALGLPVRGGAEVWREALKEAGVDETGVRGLKPNPQVSFIPARK